MDHKNLTFSNFTTDRVTRWRLIVEEYGPKIVYLPGKKIISLPMLSLAYQNLSRMMNQHFLKKSLHWMNKLTHFQSPSMLFPRHNSPIRRFNGALQTMTQTSKQE
jgi:hypothetical protein